VKTKTALFVGIGLLGLSIHVPSARSADEAVAAQKLFCDVLARIEARSICAAQKSALSACGIG